MPTALGASALAAAADLALMARLGSLDAILAAKTTLVLLAAAALAGLALGLVEHVLLRALGTLARRSWRPRSVVARGVTFALWVLAAGLWMALIAPRWAAWPFALQLVAIGFPIAIAPLLHACVCLAELGLARAEAGLRARVALTAVALSTALGAAALDRVLLPRLYPRFHDGLLLVELLAFQLALVALWPGRRPGWDARAIALLATLTLGALATSAYWLERDARLAFVVLDQAPVAGRVLSMTRSGLDRDGDGYASLLGGGDCDDQNADVHPGRFDMPDDGVDQDCSGSDADLASVEVPLPPAPPQSGPFNVLLITVDALRPDHLGLWGYERPTSPNIDRLGRGSLRFERTYAQANATSSSLPSLHTGRYPSTSPWHYDPRYGLPRGWAFISDDENTTLAELLARRGYRTAAVGHGNFVETMGLGQGFDSVEEGLIPLHHRFQDFLATDDGRPWLFWMHFSQPHFPYKKHDGFDFGDDAVARYDSEIAMADREIGEVLASLAAAGARDETIVVLTADHGEAFGEHGGAQHASSLYEEQIRVPLLLRAPGLAPGVVEHPAELVDVLPTLLSLVGASPPLTDGESLLGLLTERPRAPPVAYSEHYFGRLDMRALVSGQYKIIERSRGHRSTELYDLRADPSERLNLAEERPDLVRALRERLGTVRARGELALLRAAARGDAGADVQLATNLERMSNPAVQMAAARALSATTDPAVVRRIARLVERRRLATDVRVALVESIALIRTRDALEALIRAAGLPERPIADVARARALDLAAHVQPPLGLESNDAGERLLIRPGARAGRRHVVGPLGRPRGPKGRRYAWSRSKTTRLVLWIDPDRAASPLTLIAQGRAHPRSGDDGLAVDFTLGAHRLGHLAFPAGQLVARSLEIPQGALSPGPNTLLVSYAETFPAGSVRTAVQWHAFELRRVGPDGEVARTE